MAAVSGKESTVGGKGSTVGGWDVYCPPSVLCKCKTFLPTIVFTITPLPLPSPHAVIISCLSDHQQTLPQCLSIKTLTLLGDLWWKWPGKGRRVVREGRRVVRVGRRVVRVGRRVGRVSLIRRQYTPHPPTVDSFPPTVDSFPPTAATNSSDSIGGLYRRQQLLVLILCWNSRFGDSQLWNHPTKLLSVYYHSSSFEMIFQW